MIQTARTAFRSPLKGRPPVEVQGLNLAGIQRRLTLGALINFALWASLLVLIPLLRCGDYMPNPSLYYASVLLLGLAMISNILLIQGHPQGFLPLLILAMAFVPGYFLKMVSLVRVFNSEDTSNIETWGPQVFSMLQRVAQPANMAKAWFLTLAAYLGLTAAIMLSKALYRYSPTVSLPQTSFRHIGMYRVLMFFGAMACVLYPISIYFGIGFMSQEQTKLPFVLTGVINYARFCITFIFLTIALHAYLTRNTRFVLIGVGALIVNALLTAVATGSRSGFVAIVIYFIIVGIVYNTLTKKLLSAGFALVLVTALLHPVISEYRDMVTERGGVQDISKLMADSFRAALNNKDASIADYLWLRIYTLVDRVQGFSGLLFFSSENFYFDMKRLFFGLFVPSQVSLSRYLTDDLMNYGGFESGRTHGAAPGFVGSLYFLSGPFGVFFGVFFWSLLLQGIYAGIRQSRLVTAPVIIGYLMLAGLQYFSEGNLALIIKDQAAVIPFFYGLEHLCRRSLGSRSQ